MRRKKVERFWSLRRDLLVNAQIVDFQAQLDLFSLTDDDIPAAAMRLHRVMGNVRVFVDGYVAGDTNLEIWHGAILEESENTPTQNTMLGGFDDNAAWLWRAPVPLFPTATAVNINDFRIDHQFDWPIRGGKGSTVGPGMAHRYVIHVVTPGSAISCAVTLLSLFSA